MSDNKKAFGTNTFQQQRKANLKIHYLIAYIRPQQMPNFLIVLINSGFDAPDDGDFHGVDPEDAGGVPKEGDKVPKDSDIFPAYF